MTEWLGLWEVPGGPRDVGGSLEIGEDKRVKLHVLASLADPSRFEGVSGISFPVDPPIERPVIYGQVEGRDFTVLGAECTSFPLLFGAVGTEHWVADVAIEARAAVAEGEQEPRFGGISFTFDTLPFLASLYGPEVRRPTPEGPLEVSNVGGDLLTATLPDGATVVIRNVVEQGASVGKFTVTADPIVVVELPEGATWQDLLKDWHQPIQALLWVLTARASKATDLHLRVDPVGEQPGRSKWATLHVPLVADDLPEQKPGPDDVLVHLADLPGGFEVALARWLELWADLRHVLLPLAARAVAPFAYSNDRFYTAAAAIEAYDRHIEGSRQELDKKSHRERVAAARQVLEEHLDPALAEWASNGLPRFNQLPLWKCILRRLNSFPTFTETLLGDRAEVFARAVESARHGHAHALESEDDFRHDGGLLYMSADVLVWLVRLCVLVDLGVAPADAEARVLQHQSFLWLVRGLRRRLDDIEDPRDRQVGAGVGAPTTT